MQEQAKSSRMHQNNAYKQPEDDIDVTNSYFLFIRLKKCT